MKLQQTALAASLLFPVLASAQSNADLQRQIDALQVQIKQLTEALKGAAPAPVEAVKAPSVDPEEFNRIKTKVEAMEDQGEVAGFKGLRISGGIDPTYIYNRNKRSSSFAFLNNFSGSDANGNAQVYSYDNSYFGLAYLDVQKEIDDGGTRFRLTLAPSKSAGSSFNIGNIVHEASASIPIDGPSTRLLVGQLPDVSGYQPFFNSFVGANSLSSNLLYPGYSEYFVTKNLLFDFTAATAYTGVGLDFTRGAWDTKLFLANFNSARNDVVGSSLTSTRSPVFVYNATYAKEEFWGVEFTGYEGKVTNPHLTTATNTVASRLDQFEIDGWWTRGDINTNLQLTLGRQKDGAFNGGDSQWYGLSYLLSKKVNSAWTVAGRFDYLNNDKNGGGTFNTYANDPSGAGVAVGDFYNGFGPGDPNDPSYDPNKGSNRFSLTGAATYRLTRNVAFRGELRFDHATKPSFYQWSDGTYRKSNTTIGLQTIVNF